MASNSVLHGIREEEEVVVFSPSRKLFSGHGFAAVGTEEQSTSPAKKDSIFGSYGWSEHSSSSGLSTPFGSELGSTETDETESEGDEDFMAELTRQMADYTLNEEDEVVVDDIDCDENRVPNCTPKKTIKACGVAERWFNYNPSSMCYYNQECLSTYVMPKPDSANQMKSSNTGIYSTDDLKRPIQVYNLKDQPWTVKQRSSNRVSKTESTQQIKNESQVGLGDQHHMHYSTVSKRKTRGGYGYGGVKVHHLHHHQHPLQSGSGMRAVFLGGPGSINGSSGTGVFLPRKVSTEAQKRSGSSTVLIPERVLQTLQLHFNNMDALSQSNASSVSPTHLPQTVTGKETEDLVLEAKRHSEDQTWPESGIDDQEMQLPQEWTY